MSNLCSEILRVQEPSLIQRCARICSNGTDVSCNLGSTNVVNMMTSAWLWCSSIRAMVRALTFVTDSSHIVAVPTLSTTKHEAHTFRTWRAMGLTATLPNNWSNTDHLSLLSSLASSTSCHELLDPRRIKQHRAWTWRYLPQLLKNQTMPAALTLISMWLESLFNIRACQGHL